MRNLIELNLNEGGEFVRRMAPSNEEINNFEKLLGVKLPEDYLEFLRFSNGGHPELDSFLPENADADNRWAINRFYSLGAGYEPEDLKFVYDNWKSILGERCFPIAADGGGNQLYLDMANGGCVGICIHDQGFKRRLAAESFSEFIDKLERNTEYI